MTVVERFVIELPKALDDLSFDEWSLTKARERVLVGAQPSEAFENIVPVLRLAEQQQDSYVFASCVWLATSLANLSGTTQRPEGLEATLEKLTLIATGFDCIGDLNVLLHWYRIAA